MYKILNITELMVQYSDFPRKTDCFQHNPTLSITHLPLGSDGLNSIEQVGWENNWTSLGWENNWTSFSG